MSHNLSEKGFVDVAELFIFFLFGNNKVCLNEDEAQRFNFFLSCLLNFNVTSVYPLDEYQTDKIRYMLGLNTKALENKYEACRKPISNEDKLVFEYSDKIHMYVCSPLLINEKTRV